MLSEIILAVEIFFKSASKGLIGENIITENILSDDKIELSLIINSIISNLEKQQQLGYQAAIVNLLKLKVKADGFFLDGINPNFLGLIHYSNLWNKIKKTLTFDGEVKLTLQDYHWLNQLLPLLKNIARHGL